MTIADDFIHYSNPRALTVSEQARLQSFDYSFVFQGKLDFEETPEWKFDFSQRQLVIGATPPLLCKQIVITILRHIR